MRLIITGASGNLGRSLVTRAMQHDSLQVIASTSQLPQTLAKTIVDPNADKAGDQQNLTVVGRNELLGQDFLQQGDVLINAGFPRSGGDPFEISGALAYQTTLAQRAAAARVSRFVNISSQSVYSPGRSHPAKETDPVACHNVYATAKYTMELVSNATLGPGAVTNIRLSSLIGVGYDNRLISRYIRSALKGEPIVVEGQGAVFDLMDLRDAADALLLVSLSSTNSSVPVLNVGASNPITLTALARQVASRVEEVTGRKTEVHETASSAPGFSSALDCTLLRERYSYNPARTLQDSVDWILHSQQLPPTQQPNRFRG